MTNNFDNNFKNNIIEIKNEIIELNNLIDKKCFEIYETNEKNYNKISKLKIYMENIILDYHKICEDLFTTLKN